MEPLARKKRLRRLIARFQMGHGLPYVGKYWKGTGLAQAKSSPDCFYGEMGMSRHVMTAAVEVEIVDREALEGRHLDLKEVSLWQPRLETGSENPQLSFEAVRKRRLSRMGSELSRQSGVVSFPSSLG